MKRFSLSGLVLAALLLASAGFYRSGPALAQMPAPAAPQDGDGTVFLPVIHNKVDSTLGPPMFGVQMYGNTSNDSVYHPFLLESQATWLRAGVNWDGIEPENTTPENFYWSYTDSVLGAAAVTDGDLNMIATVGQAPEWAIPSPSYRNGPILPEKLPDFAQFVAALVERFDGDGLDDAPGSPQVNYWEFYNEPDRGTQGFIGWGHDGDQYANMLATIYPAVKAANPHAQVVFGGLAYDWFEEQGGPFVKSFVDDVLNAGGGAHFDVMNFHGYDVWAQNWTDQGIGIREKTEAVRDLLEQHGYGDKPMFITEAGTHSNWDPLYPSTPEIQASYVVELYTQGLAANVQTLIWWMLYDQGGTLQHGLITNGGAPVKKKSFDAYQVTVDQLGTAHYVRQLTDSETGAADMEVYQFNDLARDRTLYVAWLDPIDTTATKSLRLSAGKAITYDLYGVSHVIFDGTDGSSDGKVTITVGGQPVYIEISQ